MNKLKKYVLSMLMLTSGLVCLAQSGITVRGKVEDAEGAPVLGAAVMVRGTDSGALVDADGAYRLDNVPADAVLVASSLGLRYREKGILYRFCQRGQGRGSFKKACRQSYKVF